MCFVAFTYFYKHFFDNCIVEKECVFVSKKTNKKKIKKVEMPKRLLSFIYLILVFLLYNYMNFNVFICSASILFIFILRMCQKYDDSLIDILYVLDNNIIIKAIYFSFYWICKFLFFIFTPLYKRLEAKKNNNFDSVKNLFVKRLGNTDFGGLLPLLGFSNDNKKNNDIKNNEENIGNIMNIFGDLGELHKLFEDTKSSTKTSSSTDDSHLKDKISDPKWLKKSTLSSTDNLDKYILSNIASNIDIKKTTNLNNKKIIEINDNVNKHNSKKNSNKKNSNKKNSNKKNSNKKNSNKKNSNKDDNKNSEELVNLYKKMNDVFSSIQLKK
jgi:hypothetical protein